MDPNVSNCSRLYPSPASLLFFLLPRDWKRQICLKRPGGGIVMVEMVYQDEATLS